MLGERRSKWSDFKLAIVVLAQSRDRLLLLSIVGAFDGAIVVPANATECLQRDDDEEHPEHGADKVSRSADLPVLGEEAGVDRVCR